MATIEEITASVQQRLDELPSSDEEYWRLVEVLDALVPLAADPPSRLAA